MTALQHQQMLAQTKFFAISSAFGLKVAAVAETRNRNTYDPPACHPSKSARQWLVNGQTLEHWVFAPHRPGPWPHYRRAPRSNGRDFPPSNLFCWPHGIARECSGSGRPDAAPQIAEADGRQQYRSPSILRALQLGFHSTGRAIVSAAGEHIRWHPAGFRAYYDFDITAAA